MIARVEVARAAEGVAWAARASGADQIGVDEVVAFVEQSRIHRLSEGVCRAIAEIESRLWIETLAVALKRGDGEGCEMCVMWNDLGLDEGQEIVEVVEPVASLAREQDLTGFLIR
jgi:hypothetical protein